MTIQTVLLLCTGLCTVAAYLCTRRVVAALAHANGIANDAIALVTELRRKIVQVDGLSDEIEALKKRHIKLAGRFARDERGSTPALYEQSDGLVRDPHFDAMMALQNATERR